MWFDSCCLESNISQPLPEVSCGNSSPTMQLQATEYLMLRQSKWISSILVDFLHCVLYALSWNSYAEKLDDDTLMYNLCKLIKNVLCGSGGIIRKRQSHSKSNQTMQFDARELVHLSFLYLVCSFPSVTWEKLAAFLINTYNLNFPLH